MIQPGENSFSKEQIHNHYSSIFIEESKLHLKTEENRLVESLIIYFVRMIMSVFIRPL
jgi:hypothetical protein